MSVRWRLLLLAIATATFASSVRADACRLDSDRIDLSVSALEALESNVRTALLAGDTLRGVELVAARVAALSSRSDTASVDGRFVLRNLALRLNAESAIPPEARLALLKAAATGFVAVAQAPDEDLKFDVVMYLKALEQFQREGDPKRSLQSLVFAVELDHRMPDDRRTIKGWTPAPFSEYFQQVRREPASAVRGHSESVPDEFGTVLALARLTKGDKLLARLRGEMAREIYYSGFAWKDGDSSEAILRRADALVRLADELADVTKCDCARHWQWKPVMLAGSAYFRLGHSEQGRHLINRATQMARDIPDAEYRLSEFRFVLSELLVADYDKPALEALATEMLALANSLDSPLAKEERERIPQAMKNWGLGSPR